MHPNPAYLNPADANVRMLKASVQLGLPMALLGQIIATFRTDAAIPLPVLRYTFGPLIVHEQHKSSEPGQIGWLDRDTLLRWRPRVYLERLEILCGERPDLVSPAEIWLVMYNATMEAPLRHQLTEIYCWAASRAAVAAGMQAPLGGNHARVMRLPEDDDIFNGNLQHEYREMCRAIIEKVVRHSTINRPRKSRVKPDE